MVKLGRVGSGQVRSVRVWLQSGQVQCIVVAKSWVKSKLRSKEDSGGDTMAVG